MSDLLPSNATDPERAISLATERIGEIATSAIRALWNPDACPAALLPWLAWALSVEPWDKDWPEQVQRDVIKASIPTHRIKGTTAAIKAVLTAAGLASATVLEHLHRPGYGGQATYNGHYYHGEGWAKYRVILQQPITNRQADIVRSMLEESDRAVCELAGLDFTAVPNTYNGESFYDGAYNYGSA